MDGVVRQALTCFPIVVALIGCRNVPVEFRDTARSMDRIADTVAEYGTVTISSPLLAAPQDRFAFQVKAGPEEYFQQAKTEVQGRAAEFEQVANLLSVGLSVAADPTIATAYAAQMTQYLQTVAQRDQWQRLMNRKLQAQNNVAELARVQARDAAARQYRADVAAANALAEPAKSTALAQAETRRATAELQAETAYAGAFQAGEMPPLPDAPVPATKPAEADADLAKPATDARGVLAAMTGFGGLLANKSAPTLSNRTALITASGDNATEAIFQILGDPTISEAFTGKRELFGVSMVAVNPGWRTRKGYSADIAVTCRYQYVEARPHVVRMLGCDPSVDPSIRRAIAEDYALTDVRAALTGVQRFPTTRPFPERLRLPAGDPPRGASPLVAAVSPMTETQALDLSSSYRRQDEFALSLAFALQTAGMGAQARVFEQFVRSRQQDVATATANVAVNAYSHLGGMFGFQVGPRLQAIERVRKGKLPGAADVLDRQSFPTLILFGLDQSDLVRLKREADGRLVVYEAQMLLIAVPSWMPAEGSAAGTRLRESDRIALSYDLNTALVGARRYVGGLDPTDPASMPPGVALELAEARIHALKYKAFGAGLSISLPDETFGAKAPRPCTQPTTAPCTQPTTVPVTRPTDQ